ncbi:hypothetical protein IT418_02725 [bacterium]|nr:hypothetical protein [bacterium]
MRTAVKNTVVLRTVFLFFSVFLLALFLLHNYVYAAGKSVTITPASLASSTPTEITYQYIPSTEFGIGDSVTITAATGVTVSDCSTSTEDADGDGTNDGSALILSQTYTYLFSAATTDATSTGVTFCIEFTAPTGNYSITFMDDKAIDANNDFGGTLIYVGDANDVTVTAQVQPILSFVIRNAADSSSTNTCNLGVLTPASVSECEYRLKIGTNSSSGYIVNILSDGDLRKSGSGDVVDSDDIDRVTEGSGSIIAGTEAYGIELTGNSTSVGTPVTEGTDSGFNYSNDDTPIPITGVDGTKTLYIATTPNDPTTTSHSALVTHRATIDTGTHTGNYQQIVTYTVTANF